VNPPSPTVFIYFLNTCSVFHTHLPSPVCNLDIDNSGGQVPARGELLPSSFPGIVRILLYFYLCCLCAVEIYAHVWSFINVEYASLQWPVVLGIAETCSFRFLCSAKDN